MLQLRSMVNETYVRDLKARTLRGQLGQKSRGFFLAEAAFGYRSFPVGTVRCDKKSRPPARGVQGAHRSR